MQRRERKSQMEDNNSLEGKTCMVTGATSGIGQATALGLARLGARVVVVGRNPEKCTRIVKDIRQQSGNQNVDCLLADLSDQAQIHKLALEFQESYPHLHVLVNNAGGFFLRRQESIDGLEMTFALNHLNYFLLTGLLIKVLKGSAPARIVNVSSESHRKARLDFSDLQMKRNYRPMQAYGRSKLANILFTRELARRLEGSGVTANALHPGFVATNIGGNNGLLARLVMPLIHLRAISPQKGAETSIYLASSLEIANVSGEYFIRRKSVRAGEAAYDDQAALQLWNASQEMTGESWAG
jgi:NAD(P)-dependent dehydrogenase (short-subunit alcohol dehydrogenase family)